MNQCEKDKSQNGGRAWIQSAAAAAKLLQSCLTLCDAIDGSPPGFPIPGILQARVLEWITIAFSHPYMTTGKTIALTRRTFADKVISLLFNMLSRLVITFLPRSKSLLIIWLHFTFTFHFHALEKAMAPHSSTLARKIPWMEEPGRLQSMGLSRVFCNTTVQKHQFFGAQLSL